MPIRCPHCQRTFDLAGTNAPGPGVGGAALGRFELVALLERSPFGITRYQARDPYLDRPVRLTLGPGGVRGVQLDRILHVGPPTGDAGLDRFVHEARLLARLHHPAIPPVYELGLLDGLPYMASRFVEGRTLAQFLQDGPPAPEEAARMVAEAADAVHHLHEQGFVHRDLRPGTILVDEAGRAHLVDFGRATPTGDEAIGDDEPTWENLAYVSPEMIMGEGHRLGRSDVHSLGLVLYEFLTGRLPFPKGRMIEVMRAKVVGDLTPPRSLDRRIDRALEATCLKALARDPGRRHPTAAALAEDLRRYLADQPTRSRPARSLGTLWPWRAPDR